MLGLDKTAIQQVEQNGQPLSQVSITTPLGGIITHADVRIGQLIGATDHLYHVVQACRRSGSWARYSSLRCGISRKAKPMEATFTALPGESFQGQIDHLRLKMNRQTRTEEVVIAVENPTGRLRPGMSGRVRISVQVEKEAIVCPVGCGHP